MAVPKRRKSKSRRDMRRAHHQKPPRVTLNACSRCHEPKFPHRVCKNCGYYNGKDVLHLEDKAHGART